MLSAGIELLTRVVGVLLAAIAVQLVAEGIDSWVRPRRLSRERAWWPQAPEAAGGAVVTSRAPGR